jgi:4-hydroxythreonine-4-phosphate dehydrogenase
MKPVLGLTIGDPAGIGPEIAVKVAISKQNQYRNNLILFGSVSIITHYLKLLKLPININVINKVTECKSNEINIYEAYKINIKDIKIGKISPICGGAAFYYLNSAIEWAVAGQIHGIITCPINKEAMQLAGFKYNGHTEILAEKTKTQEFAMVLLSDDLNIIHVTTHIPLKKVSELIKKDKILKTIRLADLAMRLLGKIKPKIAVSSLNPHAGEGGIFGYEEEKEIIPAISQANMEQMNVYGPFSPDTIFYRARNGEFDIVVAMYHDQGHIAMKLIHFDNSVNYTVGLPFIRTSVDHGTAFDIAGTLTAKTSSLEKAIELAIKIHNNMNKL